MGLLYPLLISCSKVLHVMHAEWFCDNLEAEVLFAMLHDTGAWYVLRPVCCVRLD